MSFKQREQKRRRRAAVITARRKSGTSSGKWWRTIVKRDTCCARCSGILRIGREMVYRHSPREALCLSCADAAPDVTARPSIAWERWRRRNS